MNTVPQRPGNLFQVTQVWVTDHQRRQLAAVQYTAVPRQRAHPDTTRNER
jgi:hypothetical protein